jgi:hypothetical protein
MAIDLNRKHRKVCPVARTAIHDGSKPAASSRSHEVLTALARCLARSAARDLLNRPSSDGSLTVSKPPDEFPAPAAMPSDQEGGG